MSDVPETPAISLGTTGTPIGAKLVLPRATLVFNPAAGRGGSEGLAELRERLAPTFDLAIRETTLSCDADECALRAVADGARLVIAAGGDGTVSAVASALVGTDVALGIVPRGTASSVAAALGIPADLDAACVTLVNGRIRRIDTARANGRTMVLLAAIGLHANTIGETTREAKDRWGLLAYVTTGLAQLANLEPFEVVIESDTEIVRCQATAVTVANVAPRTTMLAQGPSVISPDDGLLDVTVVSVRSLAEAVATGLHLFRTAARTEPATRENVGYLSARRLRIEATPPRHLLVDGEAAGMTPVELECLPRSLRVVIPPDVQLATKDAPEEKLEGLPALEVEPKSD